MSETLQCFGQEVGVAKCAADGRILELDDGKKACQVCFDALKANVRKYEDMAKTDLLTGLPNRRGFTTIFEAMKERGEAFGLVFVDLRNFKKVNDRYGHEKGDEFLVRTADYLRGDLRGYDTPTRLQPNQDYLAEDYLETQGARLGGDEFANILRLDVDADKATLSLFRPGEPLPRRTMDLTVEERVARAAERIRAGFSELDWVAEYNAATPADSHLGLKVGQTVCSPWDTLEVSMALADPKGAK